MKKKIYSVWFAGLFLCSFFGSCEEEIQGLYSGEQGVYFPDFDTDADRDSLVFSFLGRAFSQDTVWLNVRLLGESRPASQRVRLLVADELTTAVSGTHYVPLEADYEFPPDEYEALIPIVLIKHPVLDDEALKLTVRLEENDDFVIAYPTQASVRIIFSNLIMKPAIWDGTLAPLFGVYSRTKHQVCMEIMQRPFPETLLEYNLERNVWKNLAWQCNEYFRENIVIDTDLVPPTRILPWF